MAKLRMIVFDVQHGFCAFLKSPTGHTLMIDCGKGDEFSPAEYILENEVNGTVRYKGYKLTKLIISHPHDDHIEDIETISTKFPPAILRRQRYDWDEIKAPEMEEEYQNLEIYADWQEKYNNPIENPPTWGVDIQDFCLAPGEAKKVDDAKYVNNSSIVVMLTFNGTEYSERFLFGGDIEQAGWAELLKMESFKNTVKGVDFFITSHHGHTSGFSTELFEVMGRPILNIVSAHRRDENVDKRYSSEEYASGTELDGEKRRMISTRNDGSIFIDVSGEGQFSLRTRRIPPNLKQKSFSWW